MEQILSPEQIQEKVSLAHTTIVEQLKQHLQDQNSEFEVISRKAQNNINLSTTILILTGFTASIGSNQGEVVLIIVSMLAWFLTLILLQLVLRTRSWEGAPLKPQWEVIFEVSQMNESDLFGFLIDSYHSAVEQNTRKLNYLSKLVNWSIIPIILQVIFTIIYTLSL